MKLYFILLFIFIGCIGYSQTLNLTELLKLKNMNFDEFDSFVVGKGYVYNQTKTVEGNYGIMYYSTKNPKPTLITYGMTTNDSTNDSLHYISYEFTNTQELIPLKSQIKKMGFSYIGMEVNNETIITNYKRRNLWIEWKQTALLNKSWKNLYSIVIIGIP